MIEAIGIRNLGVIESAQLELQPGFTALTGETGAGKTMVLNALSLLLGGRADSSAVRTGAQQLFVEGAWRISDAELKSTVEELGGEIEDGTLLVNRSVTSDGRSRAVLGGAQTPAGALADLAAKLVTVHGQSDQLRLRSIAAQRDALDEFAGDSMRSSKQAYAMSFAAFKEIQARLERLQSAASSDQRRVSELRELLIELDRLSPSRGELQDIEERINRLANVESLRISAASSHGALAESEPSALELLGIAARSLETSTDAELRELGTRLRAVTANASEISAELASFLIDLEADPAQLEQLQLRKAALVQLERRLGMELDQIIDAVPTWQAELLDLDSSDEQLEKLEIQLEATLSQLSLAASKLSQARAAAAEDLVLRVSKELADLAMQGNRFSVSVTALGEFEASGNDRVEFLLANAGSEPRPLAKGASGGELSRIMLAIELVLAGDHPMPTMIFDEVDAGVGGQAAVELGRRLRRLSEKTQVIVVTHLPQVAAFAHQQIQVSKEISGEITKSSIQLLSQMERRRELARMLSGNPDSEVALKHAEELLNSH
ncbi:MAG: repair protein RecN [Actinomycetota bacterium]